MALFLGDYYYGDGFTPSSLQPARPPPDSCWDSWMRAWRLRGGGLETMGLPPGTRLTASGGLQLTRLPVLPAFQGKNHLTVATPAK